MAFLDEFVEDMRPLTHLKHTLVSNQIGESKPSYTEQGEIQAILVHKGEITGDPQLINNQIQYLWNAYSLFYDQTKYTLTVKDRLVDEDWTIYEIVALESWFAFWWEVEYFTAYITTLH